MSFELAHPLHTTEWLNSDNPVTLEGLRGKIVLIEAFQMLCPGCVSNALPQAMQVRQIFNENDVAVIGLHTVFEHHKAQGSREALAAFLHEYRITFPVGIDAPLKGSTTPKTMTEYRLRGTPSTIIIDRQGRLRKQHFGSINDMVLGAEIMSLLREPDEAAALSTPQSEESEGHDCTEEACPIPETNS